MKQPINISILPDEYALCRLDAAESLPAWATAGGFSSITRTDAELSIVCAADAVPAGVRCEPGWTALKLEGPFEFTEIGILEGVLAPLANAGVSIIAVSTYDTDYILIKAERTGDVRAALAGTRYVLES